MRILAAVAAVSGGASSDPLSAIAAQGALLDALSMFSECAAAVTVEYRCLVSQAEADWASAAVTALTACGATVDNALLADLRDRAAQATGESFEERDRAPLTELRDRVPLTE